MLKAITIHQPWADAILLGLKHYETRSWRTSYRGPIAIHASKRVFGPGELHRLPFEHAAEIVGTWLDRRYGAGNHPPGLAQHGAIIAIGYLAEILPADFESILHPRTPEEWAERELGIYGAGWFAWRIDHVRPVCPAIPCRGQQGLWTVPAFVEKAILKREAWWPTVPPVFAKAIMDRMPCPTCSGWTPKKGGPK